MTSPPVPPTGPRWRVPAVAALLVAVTFALYGRTAGFEFVNYDDGEYVTSNPHVLAGLSSESVAWAFTTFQTGNWIPLTWLSHMLDVQLFGPDAGAHHLVNAGLHATNAVLLFLALAALTRRTWPAAAVALLFAVHPLRVESVAWVSERKDLLSALFYLAALRAYAGPRTRGRLARVAALLVLGLLAKPMVVSLPFVLLLVDAWPLERWRAEAGGLARQVLGWAREKWVLFAVVAASSALTFVAQRSEGAVSSLGGLTLLQRLANAGLAYAAYAGKSLWPADLAVFYPHPVFASDDLVRDLFVPGLAALAVVGLLTALAVARFRRAPWAAFGWLLFAGTLVPVVGIVQVGEQALADRYAYLPTIGLYVAAVWTVDRALAGRPRWRPAAAGALAVAALALAARTWDQVGHWRSSETLFTHALEVTEKNYVAHNSLGLTLLNQRRVREAGEHFERAVELFPTYLVANYNLGLTLEARGRFEEAIAAYRRVLAQQPAHALALQRVVACQRKAREREEER